MATHEEILKEYEEYTKTLSPEELAAEDELSKGEHDILELTESTDYNLVECLDRLEEIISILDNNQFVKETPEQYSGFRERIEDIRDNIRDLLGIDNSE